MREIPENIDSKFRFVLLASTRAEHLMQGAVPKPGIEVRKPSRMALTEIQDGALDWGYGPAEVVEAAPEEVEGTE